MNFNDGLLFYSGICVGIGLCLILLLAVVILWEEFRSAEL